MFVLLMVFGVVMFIALVMIHEYGHFSQAKKNGVVPEEFGLGFPPRLYAYKRKKSAHDPTVYTVNALPLGGFVKLKGEHDEDGGEGSFGAASLKAKTKILLAGVFFNLLTAIALFTIAALIGMPKLITKDRFGQEQFTVASDTKVVNTTVRLEYVEEDSPAAKAGLQGGDTVLAVVPKTSCGVADKTSDTKGAFGDIACQETPEKIENSAELKSIAITLAGKDITVIWKHEGQYRLGTTTLRSQEEVEASKNTDNPKGYFGVVPVDFQIVRSTWSAPIVALGLTKQVGELTFKGLWSAVKGLGSTIAGAVTGNREARQHGQEKASEQVSGPLGIFFVLKEGALQGFGFMLFIIAIISLTLAIMNVLPIPALDGGRLYLILFWRQVLKKPLKHETEERIVGTSFAALMLLFVLITFVDIKRFF